MIYDVLGKANEIFVIGIHVSQLKINKQQDLLLAALFPLTHMCGNDALGFLPQAWIATHLSKQANNGYYMLLRE